MNEEILIYHFTKRESLSSILSDGLLCSNSSFNTLGSTLRKNALYSWLSPTNDAMGYSENGEYVCLEIRVRAGSCIVANMDMISAAFYNYMMEKEGRELYSFKKLVEYYDNSAVNYCDYKCGMFRTPEIIISEDIPPQQIQVLSSSSGKNIFSENRDIYNLKTENTLFNLASFFMVAMHDDSFGLLRTYKHRQNDTFITFDEELLKKVLLLHGEQVDLVFCTNALWHEIYQKYVPDEMMDTTPYQYDYDNFEKAYNAKTSDVTRQYFAILHRSEAIGLIYLKYLNFDKQITEFGVALNDDSVKGRGFGTEAIKLLIDYAFDTLALETIFADTVHQNTRSQHVLKKCGFRFTHEDETFKYYRLDKSH